MRLDQTRIAIRERSLLDILDLALRVIAVHPVAMLLGTALTAFPLMLLNESLCGWMAGEGDDVHTMARYLGSVSMLVFIEAPLASTFMTIYLGQSLFMEKLHVRDVLRSLRRSWFALTWCQGVLRGVIAAWLLIGAADRTVNFSEQEIWLCLLAVFVAALRAFRPFINEIILLERNPLRSRGDYQLTVRRRSAALHKPRGADLFSRWLMSAIVGVSLVMSMLLTMWYAQGMLLMQWDWGWMMLHVVAPVCMWIAVGYFSVVRFLSYLDLRIRQEGWEVELIVRAAVPSLAGASE